VVCNCHGSAERVNSEGLQIAATECLLNEMDISTKQRQKNKEHRPSIRAPVKTGTQAMTEFVVVVVVVVAFEQIPSRYPLAGLSWKYVIFF